MPATAQRPHEAQQPREPDETDGAQTLKVLRPDERRREHDDHEIEPGVPKEVASIGREPGFHGKLAAEREPHDPIELQRDLVETESICVIVQQDRRHDQKRKNAKGPLGGLREALKTFGVGRLHRDFARPLRTTR